MVPTFFKSPVPAMPCTIGIPTISNERPDFYDFDDYSRLCDGAERVGTREVVVVRLGGDGIRFLVKQWRVPGGGHSDGLGKDRGSRHV